MSTAVLLWCMPAAQVKAHGINFHTSGCSPYSLVFFPGFCGTVTQTEDKYRSDTGTCRALLVGTTSAAPQNQMQRMQATGRPSRAYHSPVQAPACTSPSPGVVQQTHCCLVCIPSACRQMCPETCGEAGAPGIVNAPYYGAWFLQEALQGSDTGDLTLLGVSG